MFRQHLGRQCRSEILILFFDQGYGIVALGVMDLVVRCLAARLVPDPGTAFGAVRLEQPKHLSSGHVQQIRAVLDTQPSIIDLRQHLDPVEVTLAHHHPSHVCSLCLLSSAGRVTFLNCTWVTF